MSGPRFSVIIPARNAEKTLAACLEAVVHSMPQPDEVIVVDDDSSDATAAIARQYGCEVVPVKIAGGGMKPRFEGARRARHDLLVFVDSDVVVRASTFQRLLTLFQDPELSAVTGLLSRESRTPGFFTRFKNEYMNYIFRARAGRTDFIFGSIFALRREAMIYFEPVREPFTFTEVADSELGMRIAGEGRKLILDPELEVEHLKAYGFRSLLWNDYVIPFMFMRLLLSRLKESSVAARGRFSHASSSQVLAVFLSAVSAASFLGLLFTRESFFAGLAAASLLGFYLYWLPFLIRVRKAGAGFVFKTFLFLPLDALVMFGGMVSGLVYSPGLTKKNTRSKVTV